MINSQALEPDGCGPVLNFRHPQYPAPSYVYSLSEGHASLERMARNRIVDLFRKQRPASFSDVFAADEDVDLRPLKDLIPSPDAGPEALYLRRMMLEALEGAVRQLPEEQRVVFVAHEIDGRSFKEIAEETGGGVNTLLSRKRYAIRHLRARLKTIYEEFTKA